MAEQTPIEKLQPCLLDRLTDDEPGKQEESRAQRVISLQKYRRGVLRDLQWLFNAYAVLRFEDGTSELDDYPEAMRSVLNFGTRQLCGLTAPNMDRLREELAEALQVFEPRLTPRALSIRADMERNIVTFDLEGELWANPLPEHLHLKTAVDVETGQCLLGDSPHG
ncbi:MAG TPA: type VI secretion system baseplate subunit TssE [Verrucomicrobiae bacterium]|jgi:type VI secretion system protein ImpF|nr:type VI secretion system baseplate subunit TssE [Verrucomicrobiae bacterium]